MNPIRQLQTPDRSAVLELLASTGAFAPHELDVAMELVDTALTKPDQQDYQPYVLQVGSELVAYACFGKHPMTRATYDLYWIATRASQSRRGYGTIMFAFVENEIRA